MLVRQRNDPLFVLQPHFGKSSISHFLCADKLSLVATACCNKFLFVPRLSGCDYSSMLLS